MIDQQWITLGVGFGGTLCGLIVGVAVTKNELSHLSKSADAIKVTQHEHALKFERVVFRDQCKDKHDQDERTTQAYYIGVTDRLDKLEKTFSDSIAELISILRS